MRGIVLDLLHVTQDAEKTPELSRPLLFLFSEITREVSNYARTQGSEDSEILVKGSYPLAKALNLVKEAKCALTAKLEEVTLSWQ